MKTGIKQVLVFNILILITSCNPNRFADIESVEVNLRFDHFEKDLFVKELSADYVVSLRKKYGDFFNMFCERIIRIPVDNDSMIAIHLNSFINDADVKKIYEEYQKKFSQKDFEKINDDLTDVFKHYKYYFPGKPVPHIITFVSAFNYQVIATDSALGIGVDMYLGDNCIFYPSLGIPQYVYRKMRKEYIVSDCIKGWFQSDYDPDIVKTELLSQMIYYGKLLYFTDALAPGMNDTLKIGYTREQLQWAHDNERNTWGFLIDQKLLYSTDPGEYIKYINDGPTTNGLPKQSPAKLGAYIGWQIVKAYMSNHKNTTPDQLLKIDAQKLLNESGYKPAK